MEMLLVCEAPDPVFKLFVEVDQTSPKIFLLDKCDTLPVDPLPVVELAWCVPTDYRRTIVGQIFPPVQVADLLQGLRLVGKSDEEDIRFVKATTLPAKVLVEGAAWNVFNVISF